MTQCLSDDFEVVSVSDGYLSTVVTELFGIWTEVVALHRGRNKGLCDYRPSEHGEFRNSDTAFISPEYCSSLGDHSVLAWRHLDRWSWATITILQVAHA